MEAKTSSLPSCRQFSLHEILSATKNFDDALVVGKGGFGKVYKASINVDNGETCIVAIKRLDGSSTQGATEFWAEVKMLSSLRHCNLVSLIGYCNDNSEMIIVYEFMPNGTLDAHLHRNGTNLNWVQRLKISIGAARGLHYLHTGTGTNDGVIHRDVKSTNILLDQDYAAKISDFGLAKVGPTDTSGAFVETGVRGTFGYLDPEYYYTGRLTMKSDVYAFGVVLFELLCGRVAVLNDSLDGVREISLVKWVLESIKKKKVHDIIDLKIRSQIFRRCLKKFVRIASRCLSSESENRPKMAEIVVALEQSLTLQNKFDTPVRGSAGIFSIGGIIKRPFIPPEVNSESNDEESYKLKLPAFKEYKLDQLSAATDGFSAKNRVSWKGAANTVYKGKLKDDDRLVAVKRFQKSAWPDARVFRDKAKAVGQFRSQRLANLLGFCIKGDERLLVAEFMPHEPLSVYLLHWKNQPLSLAMRLRVALYSAQALDHFSSSSIEGLPLYTGLHIRRILFDPECNPRLSCFGLMRDRSDKSFGRTVTSIPPEYLRTGRYTTAQSVMYDFGIILIQLLSGKYILPGMAFSLIEENNFIDSYLRGDLSNDDETELVRIASQCFEFEPRDRPNAKSVVAALTPLQKQTDASSRVLLGSSFN